MNGPQVAQLFKIIRKIHLQHKVEKWNDIKQINHETFSTYIHICYTYNNVFYSLNDIITDTIVLNQMIIDQTNLHQNNKSLNSSRENCVSTIPFLTDFGL